MTDSSSSPETVLVTWKPNAGGCYPNASAGSCNITTQFGLSPETGDYSFTWPTQKYFDGPGTLKAQVMGQTQTIPLGLTLSNGNTTTIQKSLSDWSSFLPPTSWSGSSDPVIAATGDGPDDLAKGNSVANSIVAQSPPLFLFLGDVYDKGTYPEMATHYGWNSMDGACPPALTAANACGAPWGRLGAVTQPTIGNHEYGASPADGSAWSDYWHQRPFFTSFPFANTLFIDLNCGPSPSSCTFGTSSQQYAYVQNLLQQPHPPCVVAFWHIPTLASGSNTQMPNNTILPMWTLLTDGGATLVLNGHVHNMQILRPLNDQMQLPSAGQKTMPEIIAGAGGHNLAKSVGTGARTAWALAATRGIAYLTLNGAKNGGIPTSISYVFKDTSGNVLKDVNGAPGTGSVNCGSGSPPPPPTISSVSSGYVGQQVTISGSGLTGATAVSFGGVSSPQFSVKNDTQITATVPCSASTGLVSVTAPGGTANSPSSFTPSALPAPSVTGFNPTSGSAGTSVAISGSALGCATGVSFSSGQAASFTPPTSDTAITATVPSGATTGPISVTNATGTGTSSGSFTVNTAPPISRVGLIGVSPTTGGTNSLSITVGAAGVPAGDTAILGIVGQNAPGITSVVDSKGNAYTVNLLNQYTGTGKCTAALASSKITTALVPGDTITGTVSSGLAWGFVAEDWRGLSAPDVNAKASSAGTAGTAVSVGPTAATTAANEAVFGLVCGAGSTTVATGAGYSNLQTVKFSFSGTVRQLGLESNIVSTTGAQTASFTLSPAANWAGAIQTYK